MYQPRSATAKLRRPRAEPPGSGFAGRARLSIRLICQDGCVRLCAKPPARRINREQRPMAQARLKAAYFWMATTALVAAAVTSPASAQSSDPIKIGVIAEGQSIAGAATPGGAQIAADEINAKGGVMGRKIEIVTYDNKSSSADSVRAFQRA